MLSSRIKMPLKIKNIDLEYALFSAPFSGISNIPFRRLARKFGASFVFTEMISTRPLLIGHKHTINLTNFKEDEHPIALQIVTGRPWEAYHSVEYAIKEGFDCVDLNCGCPARKIVKSKAGSFLLSDLNHTQKILKAMKKAVLDFGDKIALSAKIRTGFNPDSLIALEFSKILEAEGFDCIIIHARSREQVHKGEPDYMIVQKVKEQVKIPVIFNGGINSALTAKLALEKTGADGLMVGQASLGKPWIFREVAQFIQTGEIKPYTPEKSEIKNIMLWHLENLGEQFDERSAILVFRRFANWYVRNIKHAGEFRQQFQQIKCKEDFIKLTNQVFE